MILNKIKFRIKKWQLDNKKKKSIQARKKIINDYLVGGKIPWSNGYSEFKQDLIANSINSNEVIKEFKNKTIQKGYGIGIDERSVEYPWIFSELDAIKRSEDKNAFKVLDAGSTLNFDFIVEHKSLSNSDVTIFTYFPEKNCFWGKRISYVFGDLRYLPFRNDLFNFIVCQSTLEHIDMDNSIYGYELKSANNSITTKSYEYLKVVEELVRVLSKNGVLLLTIPFGKFENHGFFQQMDSEMIQRITNIMMNQGTFELNYLKYTQEGWSFVEQNSVINSESYNPHTGKGKGTDGAAHSRAVCCIKFIKNDYSK